MSIYSNPFVFEKHGPFFSQYIGLCIHNFKNQKDKNTERHHIFPTCMCQKDEITGKKKPINNYWNLVYLEYEDHKLAHSLISKAFPCSNLLKFAASRMTRKSCIGIFAGENNPMFGSCRTGADNPMFGKKHSEESKQKISKKASLRKGTKYKKRNGEFIKS